MKYSYKIEGNIFKIFIGGIHNTFREVYELALGMGFIKKDIIVDNSLLLSIHSQTELLNIYFYEQELFNNAKNED